VVQERRRRAPGAQPMVPVIVTLVVVLALGFAGYALASGTASTVPAPSVVGLDTNTAKLHVANAGLSVTLVEREADDPKGVVIAQRPDPGRFVREHGDVQLVVSRGPPPVTVPDISSSPSVDDVVALLKKQGFGVEVDHAYNDTVQAGVVVQTVPSFPAKAGRDSVVKVIVSDGPAPVQVQDVSGKSFDDASQILTAQKFTVTRRDDFSSTVDKDKVIGTEPAAGTSAPRGSSVTIVVSKGPELVAVPDVRGMSLEAALKKLTDLGLTGDTRGYLPGLTVKSMDPPQGSQVPKGTKVTLVF
jgi:eukaryotic-like serine/threonine-protein kinase